MTRRSGRVTRHIRLMPSIIALACVAAGCLADGSVAGSLDVRDGVTYRYELVHSANESVCQHMKGVYDKSFRQPWNFGDIFRDRLPQTDGHYYPNMPQPWTEAQQFLWDMRYSLYPTSSEFESIQWTQMTKVGRNRAPVQIAEIDIDNDGSAELVVQDGFYGSGDDRSAADGFAIYALHTEAAVQGGELKIGERPRETFGGDIIRLFVLDGMTYLSEYEAAFGSETGPLFRHDPPERMWVKNYVGRQPIGKAMNATIVCAFDMYRE